MNDKTKALNTLKGLAKDKVKGLIKQSPPFQRAKKRFDKIKKSNPRSMKALAIGTGAGVSLATKKRVDLQFKKRFSKNVTGKVKAFRNMRNKNTGIAAFIDISIP